MDRSSKKGKQTVRTSPGKPGPLITLAMIVKDEEEFLSDCLASAKPFVDEIVVVDTGSTDRTREIALSYGAKVYDHEWKDDFAEARTVSIRYSTGEWILWLDADERLALGSGELLKPATRQKEIGAYLVTIRNYQDAEGQHILNHQMCRLFRNVPDLKFTQRIHEQMIEDIVRAGYTIGMIDVVIDHLGYIPEIFEKRDKNRRNTELIRKELEENPDNLWLLYKLAATHGATGHYCKAIELYEQVAKYGGEKIGPQLYYEWVDCLTGDGRPEEALSVCDEAEKIGFRHPELNYVRGRALLTLGRLDEALDEFEKAVQLGKDQPLLAGDAATWGFRAYNAMAKIHVQLKDTDKALECVKMSRELNTKDIEALALAAVIHRSEGRLQETKETLQEILYIDPDEPNAHSDLAKLATEADEYETARYHLERLVDLWPERFEVHQQLGNVYEALSMTDEALGAYRKALEIQPRSLYALNNAARILGVNGEYQEALDFISRAIEIDPHWANAYFNAGDILYAAGVMEEAKGAYEQALRLDPANASGFFMLGNCYFKQGHYRASQLAYGQALTIQPDYPEAENNLALAQSFMEEPVEVLNQDDKVARAA